MPQNMLHKVESLILMFAHKYTLKITSPARKDFRDIISYTLQTWGQAQASEYGQKIDNSLKLVEQNPYAGHNRHGCLVFGVGRHKIYCKIKDYEIWVLRILHERMDALRHLDNKLLD
jgi:toxin ParE1/3/4